MRKNGGVVGIGQPGIGIGDIASGAMMSVGAALWSRWWVRVASTLGHASQGRGSVGGVRVWIDQDLCTGDGLCVDHAPDVFTLLDDGIAYVVEAGVALNDPGGSGSLAWVTPRAEHSVVQAAEICPGECIFIEMPVAEVTDGAGAS